MTHPYKTECKECHGHNFYVTPHNGVGYCFNCGYTEKDGDNQRSLVRYHDVAAIRQRYTELAAYYHTCIDTPHLNYLAQRGITEQQVRDYTIGYAPVTRHALLQDTIAHEAGVSIHDGYSFLSGRLVFPYWHHGIVTDLRGRTMGDHEIRYLSLRKDGYFRGADYPYCADDMYSDEEIVITEGEIKAIFSRMAGFRTIGLPGIMSLRPGTLRDRKYIVCFDSQKNNHDIVRAIYRLGSLLPYLRIATLPLQGEKEDIDSFILSHGVEAYKRVIWRALSFAEWKQLVRI